MKMVPIWYLDFLVGFGRILPGSPSWNSVRTQDVDHARKLLRVSTNT